MTTILEIENISLKYFSENIFNYKSTEALVNLSLTLSTGEIGIIIGPSGCGKTSLLRTIAGFTNPQRGKILINKKIVYDSTNIKNLLEPDKRNVGMVFQDYALFPHLDIEKNILFALTRGLPSRANRSKELKCTEMLKLTGLEKIRNKFPHELSGGQQQRVALARALAPSPDIILLDEPFSNLDPNLRSRLAKEVMRILRITGTSALMVTHDQQEALSLSDKLGVIFSGSLIQWCKPYDLYHQPKNAEIAKFLGEGAFITGKLEGNKVSTPIGQFLLLPNLDNSYKNHQLVRVLLRPDDIIHDDSSKLKAKVVRKEFRGANFLYTLELINGEKIISLVPSHHDHALNEPIGIKPEVDHVITFSSEEAVELFINKT